MRSGAWTVGILLASGLILPGALFPASDASAIVTVGSSSSGQASLPDNGTNYSAWDLNYGRDQNCPNQPEVDLTGVVSYVTNVSSGPLLGVTLFFVEGPNNTSTNYSYQAWFAPVPLQNGTAEVEFSGSTVGTWWSQSPDGNRTSGPLKADQMGGGFLQFDIPLSRAVPSSLPVVLNVNASYRGPSGVVTTWLGTNGSGSTGCAGTYSSPGTTNSCADSNDPFCGVGDLIVLVLGVVFWVVIVLVILLEVRKPKGPMALGPLVIVPSPPPSAWSPSPPPPPPPP